MVQPAQDPPIVVSGGSVTIEFDEENMQKLSKGKHHHARKRITRIEIKGGGVDHVVEDPPRNVKITISIGD